MNVATHIDSVNGSCITLTDFDDTLLTFDLYGMSIPTILVADELSFWREPYLEDEAYDWALMRRFQGKLK